MTTVLTATGAEREIAFSADDFQRVRSLIREMAGIDLNPGKQNMVYSRLSRRLRECGHSSFSTYLDKLPKEGADEKQEFINCLTTNLTAFFREPHHFEALAHALRDPQLPVRRIWSCAASTGEEPYSIAMTVLETLGAQHGVKIDASDIDTRVLETAQRGVYSQESADTLGDARLRKFFMKGTGANAGKARVRPELKSMISYRSFNLLASRWDCGPYDAVFCRNVMIYFDRKVQRQVLERLAGSLKPGGWLFAGHSENFTEHRDLFNLVGKTAYRRV